MKDLLFNNKFTCVAVSKTKPIEDIERIYNLGHKDFGENKAQELIGKHQKLPKDIRWHMIGHLQTNKVKKVVPISYLIHSVDSLKLIKTIDKESKKLNKVTSCLLQINISGEDSKYGLSAENLKSLVNNNLTNDYRNIQAWNCPTQELPRQVATGAGRCPGVSFGPKTPWWYRCGLCHGAKK